MGFFVVVFFYQSLISLTSSLKNKKQYPSLPPGSKNPRMEIPYKLFFKNGLIFGHFIVKLK